MCKNLPITSLKDLLLSNKDSIDIRDCYVKTGIEKILSTLDSELVGLKNVKTRVREISSVLLFLTALSVRQNYNRVLNNDMRIFHF